MTPQEFDKLMEATFVQIQKLNNTKGKEYSLESDKLSNFKTDSEFLGVSPQVSLAVFLRKHLNSIWHYIRTGETLSESIFDRIDDAILYLILLKGLIIDASPIKNAVENYEKSIKKTFTPVTYDMATKEFFREEK